MKSLIVFFIFLLTTFSSCKKFLDEKSDAKLATPETYEDLQAILDNVFLINSTSNYINTMSDEYYIKYEDWEAIGGEIALGYIWDSTFNNYRDWEPLYKAVFSTNVVLDNLKTVKNNGYNQNKENQVKGAALFLRSLYFFQLVQLFANQYDESSAKTDLGIPLRLTSDFNIPSVRSTVHETYIQIISDLNLSINLLPIDAGFKTRPNKVSAYALLARVYLQMGNYEKAKENAVECLKIQNSLMDFNQLTNNSTPFELFNKEVLFHNVSYDAVNTYDFYAIVDTSLYKAYENQDLRKTLFFQDIYKDGTFRFKGSYGGSTDDLFNGLALDEVYLIRAECYAREMNVERALEDLNALLSTRWRKDLFVPVEEKDPEKLLAKILLERKKELLYRGTRWGDLKRLNKDPKFAITIKRVLNGHTYELRPNSLRYNLLIPREIIERTNMPQNSR